MADFEVAISLRDLPHIGVEAGDIIDVQPAGSQWGNMRRTHLIIKMEKLTDEEAAKLKYPLYSDGHDKDYGIEELQKMGQAKLPTYVKKRKYSVPITNLKTLATTSSFDWNKIEKTNDDYQPYLTQDIKEDPSTKDIIYDKHDEEYKRDLSPIAITP